MTYQHHKCGIVCQKHLTHSDAEGKLQRPSDKRHALARSVDHLSIVTVDHVPSNIPQSSFPARSFIFEDNEAVIRMIINRGSPNLRHFPHTHRVDLRGLFERIRLDSVMSIRVVHTTKQLADILTRGEFTTIRWKSLMRLFDTHAPPKFRCPSHHCRITLLCSLFASLSHHVERPQHTARLRERSLKRKSGRILIRSCKSLDSRHPHPEFKIQALYGEIVIQDFSPHTHPEVKRSSFPAQMQAHWTSCGKRSERNTSFNLSCIERVFSSPKQ